jgi:NAD(P)-dependent dehydrogenase (short-subunit alcohol dehydrogenase family)
MGKKRWTSSDIGNQVGRVAVVTGANSGIGFEAAKALAVKGATVVVASRRKDRGEEAVVSILQVAPDATVEQMLLDLANHSSVSEFITAFTDRFDRLDMLINNAGVMMPREREETADGFEIQFGTNHLGHFALTVQLLPLLVGTEGSRVVNVSSSSQNFGKLDLNDLQWTKRSYDRMASYGASKIANMLFTLELQRRLREAGASAITAACHPGWTATNLQKASPMLRWFSPLLGMKPWQGALPTLYTAVSKDVVGGGYYGPDGLGTMRGYPAPNKPSAASTDADGARNLWKLSEKLADIDTPQLKAAAGQTRANS